MVAFPSPFPVPSPDGTDRRAVLLGTDPAAVRTARAIARSALETWNLPELRDDVELLVSELVTNALQHGSRDTAIIAFRVMLDPGPYEVEIAVWDGGPGVPEPGECDLDAESGRGLLIVAAYADSWGCRTCGEVTGKTTWARITAKPRTDDAARG